MDTLLAILFYALSLFGIDVGSHTRVDRIRSNGTRFECLRSASGRCYYTVYTPDCSGSAGARVQGCAAVDRFALALGDERQMAARPGLRMCVSADAHAPAADCDASEAIALQ